MTKPNIVVVGSLNMDIVIEADRAPEMGETVKGKQTSFIPGGKGANQAVALARLGAQTTMIGSVGHDQFGTTLLQAVEGNGVEVGHIKQVDDAVTGIASILLAEGDNQIVVVPGANDHLRPEDIKNQEDTIADADLVLLQLEIPLETVMATAELAKRHNKKVVLNPAPAQELPEELLKHVDYLTPNQSELGILSNSDPSDIQKAMSVLMDSGVDHVVTTLGAEGAAFFSKGEASQTISGYRVPVVDTTGAGDAFNAGLAYGLGLEMNLSEAVLIANKVSALTVTKFGAQSAPYMEDVKKFKF